VRLKSAGVFVSEQGPSSASDRVCVCVGGGGVGSENVRGGVCEKCVGVFKSAV
jgi:hypothetical protein